MASAVPCGSTRLRMGFCDLIFSVLAASLTFVARGVCVVPEATSFTVIPYRPILLRIIDNRDETVEPAGGVYPNIDGAPSIGHAVTIAATSWDFVRSAWRINADPPASPISATTRFASARSISMTATDAPSRANVFDISSPSPWAAAVAVVVDPKSLPILPFVFSSIPRYVDFEFGSLMQAYTGTVTSNRPALADCRSPKAFRPPP